MYDIQRYSFIVVLKMLGYSVNSDDEKALDVTRGI